MRAPFRLFVIILALCAAATAAASGVYRWVDANGKVHYGDQPPPDAKTRQVPIRQNTPAPAAQKPKDEAPAPAAQKPKDEAPAEPKDPVRKQQCVLAKAILAKYQKAPHLLMRRPDGKIHQLTPEEQAKTIAQAKARVAKDCNPDRPTDDLGPNHDQRKAPPQGNGGS